MTRSVPFGKLLPNVAHVFQAAGRSETAIRGHLLAVCRHDDLNVSADACLRLGGRLCFGFAHDSFHLIGPTAALVVAAAYAFKINARSAARRRVSPASTTPPP